MRSFPSPFFPVFLSFVALSIQAATLSAQAANETDRNAIAAFDSAWSTVSRTYWDTALVNGRWRTAHDSLRASLGDANEDREGVRAAIRALIAVPGQSHFILIPSSVAPATASQAPGTTGLFVRMIGDSLVVWRVEPNSPAARAGGRRKLIRPGSVITHLDDTPIDSVLSALRAAAPNEDTTGEHSSGERVRRLANRLMLARLSGPVGDSVRVRLASGETFALERTALRGRATQVGNLPPMLVRTSVDRVTLRDGAVVPVIGFSAWFPIIMAELDRQLFAARESAPAGLILDLRGNPGGIIGMLAGISGHFLDSAVSLGTMHARGATIHFPANPRKVSRSGERIDVIRAPLAILVDEFTGSTSEFFASGMQAVGRARIFGVRSAGQALPSMVARLPGGDVLMHAIADHEDAAGRRVEGLGVTPDEVTPLTRTDLKAGRDAALEAARAWLEQEKQDQESRKD